MLLVVTVFAIGIGYIGWAERWAMDREAFLKEVTEYEGSRNVHYGQPGTVAPGRSDCDADRQLSWAWKRR